MNKPSKQDTIEEGQIYLKENIEKGTTCPCCKQYVKLYKRKLNSSMAYGLILISKKLNGVNTSEWFHLEDYFKPLKVPSTLRGDLPKLRHWGLIEAKEGFRLDGNPNVGRYKLTNKGLNFARNVITVPQKVGLYNKQFYGYDGEAISIQNALGSKFNWSELMEVT